MTKHIDNKNNASNIPEMSTSNWSSISPEYVARMRMQNRFKTGLDIAKYTAAIMRKDMDEYDEIHLNIHSHLAVGMVLLVNKN